MTLFLHDVESFLLKICYFLMWKVHYSVYLFLQLWKRPSIINFHWNFITKNNFFFPSVCFPNDWIMPKNRHRWSPGLLSTYFLFKKRVSLNHKLILVWNFFSPHLTCKTSPHLTWKNSHTTSMIFLWIPHHLNILKDKDFSTLGEGKMYINYD